jgi:hypothetical protein
MGALKVFDGSVWRTAAGASAGLTAYEIWLALGNTGDEQDFIDSLKGDPGLPVDQFSTFLMMGA